MKIENAKIEKATSNEPQREVIKSILYGDISGILHRIDDVYDIANTIAALRKTEVLLLDLFPSNKENAVSLIDAAMDDWETPFQKWNRCSLGYCGFEDQLFRTYAIADSENQERLRSAFPALFTQKHAPLS
jgi:hypothetical protein